MTETNVPNTPGSAEIESVVHITEGAQNDITLFTARIDIHTDVNMTGSICEIQIGDYENVLDKQQFGPGDGISFNINQAGRSYERRYKIRSIDDIINLENGRTYKLTCVSLLEYNSFHERISKAYIGTSDEIALTILDEYTEESAEVWEQSSAPIEFISNYWSPLQIIKWLSFKSRSLHGSSSFLFYQNSRQFWNFTSLLNIRELHKEPITYRYYSNTNSNTFDPRGPNQNGVPNTEAAMHSIQGLKYFNSFDIEAELLRGHVRNTVYDHDFTSKKFAIGQNSYWDTYNETALNKNMLWKQEEMGQGKISVGMIARYGGSIDGYRLPRDEVDEDLGYSRGQQIEIQVYGNDIVDIGQILNIEIPSPEPHRGSAKLDQTWSGKYYVVGKHDAYDKSGHAMALRLAKDSFI